MEEIIHSENFSPCCEINSEAIENLANIEKLANIETLLREIISLVETQLIGFNHWQLALSAMQIGLLVTIVVALIWRR
ncbi:MAG: hypothetical protein FWD19_02600 [Defluviitaleaceae bacterium]|nr:hypothetical protein [Defluviitaleaceae bacterium]